MHRTLVLAVVIGTLSGAASHSLLAWRTQMQETDIINRFMDRRMVGDGAEPTEEERAKERAVLQARMDARVADCVRRQGTLILSVGPMSDDGKPVACQLPAGDTQIGWSHAAAGTTHMHGR